MPRSPKYLAAFLLTVGCGGGSGPTSPPPPPPPPPPPAPVVATVDLSPATASVLAGTAVPLTATARDANGAAIAGKTFAWQSSAPNVATVSGAGVVSTLTPGTATITASVDGRSGQASVEVVDPLEIQAFVRPFPAATDYYATNYHDHDIPQAFFDNGRKVSSWGETFDIIGYEGHEGYDWRMAEGTPVFAVAAGTVLAPNAPGFFCPLINADIPPDGNATILIQHQLPGGVVVRTQYAHLSRRDVQPGAQVAAGQQIGVSGNVGCSLNPHLHFAVQRVTQTQNGQPSWIDPYGWSGPAADPWLANAGGAASIRLWKTGEAPSLATRFVTAVNALGTNLFFGLTYAQPMAAGDDAAPNNEFVEVSRDAAFAPATLDIAGATIRTRAGIQYTLPAGTTLSAASPTIRIYTGPGTGTATTLYMGKTTPIYDNRRECISVYNAAGVIRNRIALGTDGCS